MKKMKVVLVAINSKYIHSSLAVWYLKAAAENLCDYQHDIKIIEHTIRSNIDKLVDEILSAGAELVGFSCYVWNIKMVKGCIERLRARSNGLGVKQFILLGGPEVSFNCNEILDETQADAVIAGEGEVAFSQLLNSFVAVKGEEPPKIQGLYLKRPSKTAGRTANPTGISDESCADFVDEPPSPYSEEYFEKLDKRVVYLETSRGCPFSCAFCLSGQSTLRFFSLKRAKKEILHLAGTESMTIKFVDRTFNCNKKRSDELIKFIIECANSSDRELAENFSAKCFHLEVGADLFDDETLDLLCKAPKGLFQVEAGIQSYYNVALETCGRKSDMDKITYNLKKLIECENIHVHVDLIAGLPFETYEKFEESFNNAFALNAHMLQLGFLKLIHGSRLRGEANLDNAHGYIFENDAPYEIISNKYISQIELQSLENIEYHLGQLYNSGRFVDTVGYVIKTAKITPFELFGRLGAIVPHSHSVPLNEYLLQVFPVFSGFENVNKKQLCDTIASDYYRSIKNAKIPEFIETQSDRIRRITKQVRHSKSKFNVTGMFKVYMFCNDDENFHLVDYDDYDVVLKRYKSTKYNIKEALGI